MSQSISSTPVYKGIMAKERLELLASEPIAVIVGISPNTKTWHLHKELLISSSPFFAAALNGSFAEATSKVLKLPEDDPDTFAMFVRWLYVGDIATGICTGDHTNEADYDDNDDDHCYCRASLPIYIQAWILGDKLGCLIFKDLAMLRLIRVFDIWAIDATTVRAAYEGSAHGSKLRKFSLDEFRREARFGYFSDETDELVLLARDCVDFREDLVKSICGNEERDPREQKAVYLEVLTDENACV